MSEDIRRVLLVLAERRHLQSGVSATYLSKRLDMERRRLLKIIGMLERAGYVRVRRLEHVALVSLTALGYEKLARRRREKREKSKYQRASMPLLAVSGFLLAFLIGFVWWWLGLVPQTAGLQPANSAPLPSATSHPTEIVVSLPTDLPTAVPATAITTPELPDPLPTPIPIDTPEPNTFSPVSAAIPTPVSLLEQPANTVNIVLMGTDTTAGSWRTDTLIIVSVDPNLPSVSLLSIPRDLYVYVPGWKMSRINTADFHGESVGYPGGGPGLVKATIEYNLGVRIHYFARVDFEGFVNLLDTLGGVDVVVDCELHDTFPDPAAEGGASDIDLLPGVHHLDGKQALWYARSRWNTSDFDRGRRQQRVLRGALAQIKQLGLLPKLPELWDDLTQTVETDLSLETMLWLAQVASRLDAGTAIESRFIDDIVVRAWRTPEGAAVLLPDYERIGPLIAEALAPPDTARSRQRVAQVEVLNGTVWPDWAILAADRLLWEGFDVVSIGQADRTDYQQTVIMDITQTDKGSPADHLASILRVTDANVLPGETPGGALDFRIVVGYDFRPCYKTYWRTVHGPTPTPTQ